MVPLYLLHFGCETKEMMGKEIGKKETDRSLDFQFWNKNTIFFQMNTLTPIEHKNARCFAQIEKKNAFLFNS